MCASLRANARRLALVGLCGLVSTWCAVAFAAGDAGTAVTPSGGASALPDAGLARTPLVDAGADAATVWADADLESVAGTPPPRHPTRLSDAAVDGPLDAPADDASVDAPMDASVDAAIEIDAAVESLQGPHVPSPEELETAIQERTADAPVMEAAPEAPPASAQSTLFAIKLIFGLAVLLALAYLGGNSRVLRLQERLGIRGAVIAGFPFVAIGLVASLPSVGILTDEVIPKLRPVLQFGLGWVGFIVGAHLDIRLLDRLPRGSAYLILIEALLPFALTVVACGAVMIGVFGLPLGDPAAWRDLLLLGAAAAMTAPRRFHGFANRTWHEGRGADALLGQLDEIAGIVALLFITAYFRGDESSAWHLPGTAWLFVGVGLGVVLGVFVLATVRLPRSTAEFLAIVLGLIAFSSGLASVLRLSPVVTCFLAGTLITNFPNEQRESVFRILNRLERPIHLLFLMIVGALWNVSDWRGWVLVPLFVACRTAGKWLGVMTSRFTLRAIVPVEFTAHRRFVVPMSTMAIVLVVSIERFRDLGLSWVVTAVIGGSIVFELLIPSRRRYSDHDRGPIYDLDDQPPKQGPI